MILVAMHRGTSLVSRGIRAFEPPYSHCEIWFADQGCVISADAKGVVQKPIPKLKEIGRGTQIDFFVFKDRSPDVNRAYEAARVYVDMVEYDFRALFWGFTLKLPENESSLDKIICSGLVLQWSRDIGLELLARCHRDRVSPRMLSYSPLLDFSHSRILCKD